MADAQDLADKLLRFIALTPEARLAIGQYGREFVEINFDERVVIARYLAVVAEVGAGRLALAGRHGGMDCGSSPQ